VYLPLLYLFFPNPGAANSRIFCCFILAPFDVVCTRTMSQPDYAPNIFGVVSRMVKEDGLPLLFSLVLVWFVMETLQHGWQPQQDIMTIFQLHNSSDRAYQKMSQEVVWV